MCLLALCARSFDFADLKGAVPRCFLRNSYCMFKVTLVKLSFRRLFSPFFSIASLYTASSQEKRAEYFLLLTRIAFFACWALFPFGKAFRVCGGIFCLIGLIGYYANGYQYSTLAKFRGRWAIAIFLLFIVANTLFSKWVGHSFGYLRPTLYESWPFLFAGLEVLRSKKDIVYLSGVFLFAEFGEGLVGVWQYVTGFDPINGDPFMGGRLTGSLGTYRVGNYVGIALLPACAVYFVLPQKWSPWVRRALLGMVLLPPLFLLVYSQTRSGMLGLMAGGYLLCVLYFRKQWKVLLGGPLAFLLLILFGPERISLANAMQDGRWELWSHAWEIFLHHPIFGAGASTFKPGFVELGLEMVKNSSRIPHPHCMYLQFLSDGGIVGFSIAVSFLSGTWAWCGKKIYTGTASAILEERQYWWMTACVWAGYSSYLATGLFGHNFYRTWWLAMGMTLLGASLGACLAGIRKFPASKVEK